MFHCSNLLSENLGSKKGEHVPFNAPRPAWAGGFPRGQDLALTLSRTQAQGQWALTSWEWVTPSAATERQRQRRGFVCFPDMTRPTEGAAKSGLPRSRSVDLQSKKLKMTHGGEGRLPRSRCTFNPARRPTSSWLARWCAACSSGFPTTRPHPHKALYFNIKFLKICINSPRSEYTAKAKRREYKIIHSVTPLGNNCFSCSAGYPSRGFLSHLIYGYIFLNKL